MYWLVAGALALLVLSQKKSAVNTMKNETEFDNEFNDSPVTETDPTGVYTLIRPEGPRDANGGFDIALYAKEGVDRSKFVYMKRMNGDFEQIPA